LLQDKIGRKNAGEQSLLVEYHLRKEGEWLCRGGVDLESKIKVGWLSTKKATIPAYNSKGHRLLSELVPGMQILFVMLLLIYLYFSSKQWVIYI